MTFVLYQHDPAHSFGSVDGSGVTVTLRKTYFCPECNLQVASEFALSEHLSRVHPIAHPHLVIGGIRTPAEWIVRKRQTETVLAPNAQGIAVSLNGSRSKRCTTVALGELLRSQTAGVLEIVLTNRGAESRYRIVLRIPPRDALDVIDRRFSSRLAREDVTISDIRVFAEDVPGGPAAVDYASGLADYVYGVLAKDGAGGTSLTFSGYRQKLAHAAAVLSEFDNPLAIAICSCVRFNLNDLKGPWKPTGVLPLDVAFHHFRQLADVGLAEAETAHPRRKSRPHGVALCPVDSATNRILRAVAEAQIVEPNDLVRPGMSDEDRAKSTALLAERLLRQGSSGATEFLSQLQHDAVFGDWASRRLSSATS